MDTHITSAEAAEIIGCADSFVRRLMRGNKLRGKRIGRDWLVERESAEQYAAADRRPGRKPKAEAAE